MANEVEASELAVAKEDLTNEEISHDESPSSEGASVADVVAESSTENVNEVKLEVKTETEVMSYPNEKQDSEVSVLKETVTEKVTEIEKPLNLTDLAESSEISEKTDFETVNGNVKECVLDTKSESVSKPVTVDELQLAGEIISEPEPDSSEKPIAVGELKLADELTSGSEEVSNDKTTEICEPKSADEVIGSESDPKDKSVEIDEAKPADEQLAESEPDKSCTPEETDETKPADEQVAESELDKSCTPEETDETKLADEQAAESEPAKSCAPEETDETKPADEVIAESKPDKSFTPEETDETKPADEVIAESKPDKSFTPEETDETKPADEVIAESKPDKSCAPEETDETKSTDEQVAESEILSNYKLESSDELEPEPDDELSGNLELEQGDEELLDPEGELDSGDEEKEMHHVGNNQEDIEKPLDDDQDRRNPQYIPKGGAFYEHDNRTSSEDVENKDPQDNEKKKKTWKEPKDSEEWLHDCYDESEQLPKSTAEIIKTYGYDIRRDDAPPRARRRRKYGRGPDKYDRSWKDEQAYQIKQNNIARRGKKKLFGKDEFPPLPNQKFDSSVSKPVQRSSFRKREEGGSKSINAKLNGDERSPTTSQASRSNYAGNHNSLHSYNSNRKNYGSTNKKINDSDIKPFRNDDNKWKVPFKHGRQDDFPKPIRTQSVRNTDPPFRRSVEVNKNSTKEPHISHITDGINQMTFLNKPTDIRDTHLKANGTEEGKMNEPEVDNPANRQNPKRYSKIRKGFTGVFPPEEVPELEQSDIHKIQQEQQKSQHLNITQPLNMQNVIKRYAGTYGNLSNCVSDFVPGNSSYLQARPIISGIPQQALSPQGIHQQALSPQGIPQQALSPQVPGLPTIELQQNPLGQPNFVPPPMYLDAHFTSDVMGSFSGYSPYSGNQTGDVLQPSRGITYYNTEYQTTGQKRPPPRRQNSAIPIVRPPE